jgi:hypothetical protein
MTKEEKRMLEDMEKIRKKRTSAQQGIKDKYRKRNVGQFGGFARAWLTVTLYDRKRLSPLRNVRRAESRRPRNGVRDQKVPEVFAMLVDCVSNMAQVRVHALNP